MSFFTKQRLIIGVIGFLLLAVFIVIMTRDSEEVPPVPATEQSVVEEDVVPEPSTAVIGTSVEGRNIVAHTYGTGDDHLLFVGGIHGGYEWNSVLLAYKLIDYLNTNPVLIPKNVTITIVPSLNPDGLYKVIGKDGRFTLEDVPPDENITGTGRFNANDVDLNRNFACKWQSMSTWRGNPVSAGTSAFSEPEAQAIRDFVYAHNPSVAVFFHSQSDAVYASECEAGVLPETIEIMNAYAQASGYRAVETFDAYEITGDVEGWLASIGIPAITVELSTHETVEWEQNLAGVKALLDLYR